MAGRSPSSKPESGCRYFLASLSATHPRALRLNGRIKPPAWLVDLVPAKEGAAAMVKSGDPRHPLCWAGGYYLWLITIPSTSSCLVVFTPTLPRQTGHIVC